MLSENQISKIVFESALKVHKEFGPGLLENAYQECLIYELKKQDLTVFKEKTLPLIIDDAKLDAGYRVDLIINNKVIVEIKAVEGLNDNHMAQVLTYLKLSGCKLGLLINFNVVLLKHGFRRIVNNL